MTSHCRFFIDPKQIEGGSAVIVGQVAKQITGVLRLRVGDDIRLLDGSGNEHYAVISALSNTCVTARRDSTVECSSESRLSLSLAVCLPKGDKMDLIVQKSTELGISSLIVTNSERAVARPEDSQLVGRFVRWRKIAEEAAEQCGRGVVPRISGVVEFSQLIDEINAHQLVLLAWEEERETSLREVIRAAGAVESVMLIVGPEGGLTEREAQMAVGAGAKCVTLGKRVLRAETAAIAGCAAIMYELEGEL